MNKTLALAFGLAALQAVAPLAEAKSVPVEAPDPGRGTIGITVNVIRPETTGSHPADAVYFVRVVEDADRFAAKSLIPSTYTKGKNVYLLNAEPGRYVAVACSFNAAADMGFAGAVDDAAVAFSEPDIVKTEVEVRAGAVVFMGAIEAQSATRTQEADGAQSHYLRMMGPTGATRDFLAQTRTEQLVYIAAFQHFERAPTAEAEFWGEAARRDFRKDPAWTSRIAGRSAAPVGAAAGSGSGSETRSSDDFVSAICVDVNRAKARATGSPKEAETIASMACQTVMTDWAAHGCSANPDQDPCKKRLRSLDGSLKNSGSSMLFGAAKAGQTSICSTMIAMGNDPNAPISTGSTPLMIATAENRTETVKLLTERGDEPVKELEAELAAGLAKLHEDNQYFAKLADGGEVPKEDAAAPLPEPSPGETQAQKIERLTRSRDSLIVLINDNARAGAEKYHVAPLPLVTVETLREAASKEGAPRAP